MNNGSHSALSPPPAAAYARDEDFENVCRFLTSQEPLPPEVQQLFRHSHGEPIQSDLYNTLIYTADAASEENLIHTAAEVYHYQRLLNQKIGRTYFERGHTDHTLLHYVHSEMAKRLPGMKALPLDAEFRRKVMEAYRSTYAKVIPADPVAEQHYQDFLRYLRTQPAPSRAEAIEILFGKAEMPRKSFKALAQECFRANREDAPSRTGPRLSSIISGNQFYVQTGITHKTSILNRTPKDKDTLYIFCFATGADFDRFCELRWSIQWEYNDSTLCADNHYTSRDQLLQSMLMDIEGLYQTVRDMEANCFLEQMPQKVLLYIDTVLAENGLETLYAPKRTKHYKTKKSGK